MNELERAIIEEHARNKKCRKWFGKVVARVLHFEDPISWCKMWMRIFKSLGWEEKYSQQKRMLEIIIERRPDLIRKFEEEQAFHKRMQEKANLCYRVSGM